jgi:tetratricopeptide (TPR) repeat protein
MRGRFQEAETNFGWVARELEGATDGQEEGGVTATVLRAYCQAQQGWFCLRLGRFEEAQRLLLPGLEILRAARAWRERVDALQHAGALARLMGDYLRSRAYFEEMCRLSLLTEDRWNATIAEGNIGLAAAALGDYEEGHARMAATITSFRELGDDRMLAISLHFLGEVCCSLNRYDEAERCERESLALSGATADRWIHVMSLRVLGRIALETGDGATAVAHFRQCVTIARDIGEQWSIVQGLTGLGTAYLLQEEPVAARDAFSEALAMAWEMQALPDVLAAMLGLARVAIQTRAPEAAARAALQAALLPVLAVRHHPASSERTRDEAHILWTELASRLPAIQAETAQANAHKVPLGLIVERMLSPSLLT